MSSQTFYTMSSKLPWDHLNCSYFEKKKAVLVFLHISKVIALNAQQAKRFCVNFKRKTIYFNSTVFI